MSGMSVQKVNISRTTEEGHGRATRNNTLALPLNGYNTGPQNMAHATFEVYDAEATLGIWDQAPRVPG